MEIEAKGFTLVDRAPFPNFPGALRDARRNGHLDVSIHGSDGLPRELSPAGPEVKVGSPDSADLLESSVGQSEIEMAGGLSP